MFLLLSLQLEVVIAAVLSVVPLLPQPSLLLVLLLVLCDCCQQCLAHANTICLELLVLKVAYNSNRFIHVGRWSQCRLA
jgi:hypothetical protein